MWCRNDPSLWHPTIAREFFCRSCTSRTRVVHKSRHSENAQIAGEAHLGLKLPYRGIQGIGESLGALGDRLVAVTDMPEPILFGKTPGGLNNGENAGAIRSWYDHIEAQREKVYTRPVLHLLGLVWSSSEAPTRGVDPTGFELKWVPLWQETLAEKAKTWRTNAVARATDVLAGLISEDEARHDLDFVEFYGINPDEPAPGLPGGENLPPGQGGEFGEGDEEEDVIVAQPISLIPPGEVPMSARDVAAVFGVSPTVIRSMARRQEIRAFRFGRLLRYLKSEVESAITGERGDAAAPRGGPQAGRAIE